MVTFMDSYLPWAEPNKFSPTYITKAEYLRFRKVWKKKYAKISRQIKVLRQMEADGRYAIYEQIAFRNDPAYVNTFNEYTLDMNCVQSLKDTLGHIARHMMAEIEYAKACARFSVNTDRKTYEPETV
jgi:hypothetical protein